jgi:hypothetical protein
MCVDSLIAERVLRYFTDRWSPCLCIHDSFIVDHRRTDELIAVMKRSAAEVLGAPLRVSQDFPGLDQFLSAPHGYTIDQYFEFRRFPERSDGYLHRLEQYREAKRAAEEKYRKRKMLS